MANWYILYNGQQIGPMPAENLKAYHPTPDTMVWCEGMAQWQPIYSMPQLMEQIYGAPHHHHQGYGQVNGYGGPMPPAAPRGSGKDKTVAGILAILLGGLGVQYFYLGKIGAGLLTILLSIVTCGLWEILMLVQGIMMLTMNQEEFDQKYVFSDKTLPLF